MKKIDQKFYRNAIAACLLSSMSFSAFVHAEDGSGSDPTTPAITDQIVANDRAAMSAVPMTVDQMNEELARIDKETTRKLNSHGAELTDFDPKLRAKALQVRQDEAKLRSLAQRIPVIIAKKYSWSKHEKTGNCFRINSVDTANYTCPRVTVTHWITNFFPKEFNTAGADIRYVLERALPGVAGVILPIHLTNNPASMALSGKVDVENSDSLNKNLEKEVLAEIDSEISKLKNIKFDQPNQKNGNNRIEEDGFDVLAEEGFLGNGPDKEKYQVFLGALEKATLRMGQEWREDLKDSEGYTKILEEIYTQAVKIQEYKISNKASELQDVVRRRMYETTPNAYLTSVLPIGHLGIYDRMQLVFLRVFEIRIWIPSAAAKMDALKKASTLEEYYELCAEYLPKP